MFPRRRHRRATPTSVRDDQRLAFRLSEDLRTGTKSGGGTRGSHEMAGDLPVGKWIEIAEEAAACLAVPGAAAAGRACEVLAARLGAQAVCIGYWPPRAREPLLLGIAGKAREVISEPAREVFVGARNAPEERMFEVLEMEDRLSLTAAAHHAPPGHLYGIGVAGEYPDRERSAPLLHLILHLVRARRHLADPPHSPIVPRGAAELSFPPGHLVGRSPAAQALYQELAWLAPANLPLVITGETGVGKEHVARILHESSPRRRGPFVAVNSAAIPGELLEAEMFGVARSVATGVAPRQGKFQLADGGTLLLDEISEMQPTLQTKLLRALEAGEIEPLGGCPSPIDIRFLATSNRDLRQLVARGHLRADLYYRIAGAVVEVPPLRDRQEDLPVFIESLLRAETAEAGKPIAGVSVFALDLLCGYRWPGNFRELEHELRRLVHVCPSGCMIDSDLLAPAIRQATPAVATGGGSVSLDLQENMDALERSLIGHAMELTRGNRSRAARLLGISRNGLSDKIRRLGIETA